MRSLSIAVFLLGYITSGSAQSRIVVDSVSISVQSVFTTTNSISSQYTTIDSGTLGRLFITDSIYFDQTSEILFNSRQQYPYIAFTMDTIHKRIPSFNYFDKSAITSGGTDMEKITETISATDSPYEIVGNKIIMNVGEHSGFSYNYRRDFYTRGNFSYSVDVTAHTAIGTITLFEPFSPLRIANSVERVNDFFIYPNPASSILSISSNLHRLKIMDGFGREYIKKDFSVDESLISIDVSTYPNGMYLVINDDKVKKLLVAH